MSVKDQISCDGEQSYQFPYEKLKPNNSQKTPTVLIACGSFNPITNSHLRMLEMAKDDLESIGEIVIGGYISPVSSLYEKKGLVSSEHRVAMCQLAVSTSDWLMVDLWESLSKEYMPTRVVLEHFRDTLESNLGYKVHVKFVCGGDLVESFNIPNVWRENDIKIICKDFGIVCIDRINSNPEKAIFLSDIMYKYRDNIRIVHNWIEDHISSTVIRLSLKRGLSVRYLIPDLVVNYIASHSLYN